MVGIGKKITAKTIDAMLKPGRHAVGDGLYLQVVKAKEAGDPPTRSWLFRYTALDGKRREMGLGGYPTVGLAEARQTLAEAAKLVRAGGDPVNHRKGVRKAARAELRHVTFRQAAERYIAGRKAGWKNDKHAAQWPATLTTYAYPAFGALPVRQVTTAHVLKVLEPLWGEKPETASRLRGRIEAVLDDAKVRGDRDGENPARWRGHLSATLPTRSKVKEVQHHTALPYRDVPDFLADVQQQDGYAARCLELVLLTAVRTSEATGTRWAEIDLDAALWTIPASRMKAGREHRVPLSLPAVVLLRRLSSTKEGDFVFPGTSRRGVTGSLSNMAMAMTLKRMERMDTTVHGLRSTFRDWAAEMTSHPHEIAEAALAHVVRDKVVAAYQRGDLLDRRRTLMNDWAAWCASPADRGQVVKLRA